MSYIQKLVVIGVALLLPLIASAESLVPQPPPAARDYNKKTLCVEPVPDMRRNHMKYLLHHRDLTMYKGIRTKQFSLKQCIDCHNAPSPKDGKVASIYDKNHDHFCSTCHYYAAVKIDCFECHSDKPANTQYRYPLADAHLPGLMDIGSGKTQKPDSTMKNMLAEKKVGQK